MNYQGLAKYKTGKKGDIYVIANGKWQKSKKIIVNGLEIRLGGKYELLEYDDWGTTLQALKIPMNVKNIDERKNCLESYWLKYFDAKGVELDVVWGSKFGDKRAVDEDVEILAGAELRQNSFIEYKIPYVFMTMSIRNVETYEDIYVKLALVGEGTQLELLQKIKVE